MTDDLKQFLFKANTRGFGSSEINEEKLPNGEKIIHFRDGDFEFKDTYYGGEPYSGQEVIFANDRVVWAMQYRGEIFGDENFAPIYQFLGKVLTGTKVGLPRGIDGTRDGEFSYHFAMDGDLENFSAHEEIFRENKLVYTAKFLGGLVDLRREE